MSLIVNADDFGISNEVNNAIAEAFEKGYINRTTLMTNMPYAKEAMDIARNRGFIDRVGIHLNLTSGRPISEGISKDTVMCDANGEFTADFARNMKTRFFLAKKTSANIEEELTAQLEEYKRLGGTLWHVDSHHHVHTDPSVWKVLKKVLKRYPVTSVRLGRNMYKGGNPLMHIYKFLLNSSIKSFCKNKENLFGSAQDYDNYTSGIEAGELVNLHDELAIEIMVHPMYDDNGTVTDSYEELKKYI